MENVRKITRNSQFRVSGLIPNSSYASIPGVERDVPRDVCMEAGLYADILFYGSVVDHGLSKRSLEEIYKHHCVEGIIKTGKSYGMKSEEDSIKVLSYYLQRVAGDFS